MPKFSRTYQPNNRCGGRKPSAETIAKRQAEEERKLTEKKKAFENFLKSEKGFFNGFEFCELFHNNFDKANALECIYADDGADAVTSTGAVYHVGEDGLRCYIMTEESRLGNATKFVSFNRSIYIF